VAELANAIAEVIATALRAVGYVGRPRRRAAISDDLKLLQELSEHPYGEFGPGTAPYVWLVSHIYQEVGEYAGLDFRTEKRKASIGSIILSTVLWGTLGWLSFYLVEHGYGWWATFSVVPAAVLFLATLTMLTEKEPIGVEGNLSESGEAERDNLMGLDDLGELPDAQGPDENDRG
jgi:hypothetical protein